MRFIKPIALEVTIILLAAAMMTLFAVSCRGDEPVPPVPEPIDTPSIVLPMTPEGEPTPIPDVDPRVIDTINPDEWYMIESTISLIILQSPTGGLVVEVEESPITIKGKFAGGDGKNETRKYTSPFVYSVSGTKPGKTELILIPVGVEDEASIVRQILTVSGQGPIPPPEPKPEPDPPKPTAKHVRLSIITDSENLSPDAAMVLNALVGWNELFDSGSDYRLYDIATPEPDGKKAIEQLNGPVPGIVITNKDTGAKLHNGPLPSTFADLKKLVGGITGG